MSKHTPGPWRECGHDRGGCECRQVWSTAADCMVAVALTHKDEGYTLGEGPTQETAEANARLIAAAPDLLSACITAIESLDAIAFAAANGLGPAVKDETDAHLRAAIAKAEGGGTL